MTNSQILESARYCEQGGHDSCVCCGRQYVEGGEYCSYCQSPIELSRTVQQRGTPASFIPVLGASGAGKTVYLGFLLDVLSHGTATLKGFASGVFSVGVQQETMAALENRRFPEKTASETDRWKWVHCEVARPKKPKQFHDLVTPDLAGEALALEVERPGTCPAIRGVVQASGALILLCDSLRTRDAALQEDMFLLKLVTYVVNQRAAAARGKRAAECPVAIVFTKCDGCEEARQDPGKFAANNLPRLVQFCQRHFACHRFFATSIVGSSATLADDVGRRACMPFHIEPYGVCEPLEWILSRS